MRAHTHRPCVHVHVRVALRVCSREHSPRNLCAGPEPHVETPRAGALSVRETSGHLCARLSPCSNHKSSNADDRSGAESAPSWLWLLEPSVDKHGVQEYLSGPRGKREAEECPCKGTGLTGRTPCSETGGGGQVPTQQELGTAGQDSRPGGAQAARPCRTAQHGQRRVWHGVGFRHSPSRDSSPPRQRGAREPSRTAITEKNPKDAWKFLDSQL